MNKETLAITLNAAKNLCSAEIGEQEKPTQLVANGKGTFLYTQKSAWGHIWSAIHWICGTGDAALAKVIRLTADHLQLLSQERQKFCKMIEAEGVLGEYWKTHSVVEMRSSFENQLKISCQFRPQTAQLENLFSTIRWADQQLKGSDEVMFDEKALRVFEGASSLETIARAANKLEIAEIFNNRWIELGGSEITTLNTLYRELNSVYPDNNEELFQKRDTLQDKLGYCLGGEGWGWTKNECPPELLFGPIVKLAYKISLKNSYDLNEYKALFNSLTTGTPEEKQLRMQKTASKIIHLARFFREKNTSKKLEDIPDLIVNELANKAYLSKIGLYDSDATKESDCCRVGGGTRAKVIAVPNFSNYNRDFVVSKKLITIQEPIPIKHRRSYYRYHKAQDGTEILRTFFTYSPTSG
jgi:hypothetical protein